ncbi:unnamed protein product, partial [Ilex paraguariensis]
ELHTLLSRPLQPKSFSHWFLAGVITLKAFFFTLTISWHNRNWLYSCLTGLVHLTIDLTLTIDFLSQAGVSTLLQNQFEELANKEKFGDARNSGESKRRKLVVVGRDSVEPLQALRSAGRELIRA